MHVYQFWTKNSPCTALFWSRAVVLRSLVEIGSKVFWQKDPKSFTELPIISLFFVFLEPKFERILISWWFTTQVYFMVNSFKNAINYQIFDLNCFFITLVIFNSCIFFSFMGWNQSNILKKCQICKSLKKSSKSLGSMTTSIFWKVNIRASGF